MTHTTRPLRFAIGLVAAALISAHAGAAGPSTRDERSLRAGQTSPEVMYQAAKTLFDALDYENAVRALDQAIAALQAVSPMDATTRGRLASAYEMRGRSKFGLGNPEDARADFVSLLGVDPNHALTGQVSPRVVTLFDETVAQTVTSLQLAVLPVTARISIDGIPVTTSGPLRVAIGDHVISAEQGGYRSATETISAKVGTIVTATLTLERISAVINILTSPADVEVTMDGAKLGRTVAGPPSSDYADAVAKSGVPPATISAALVVSDVMPGPHSFEFTRDCSVRVSTKISVDKPDDYIVGPVALQPAVATLTVQANEPGAQVYIDGRQRGVVPFTADDLCEGPHLVELRSRFGRDSRRVEARTGDKITFDGVLKPAFAVVSISGETANLDTDMRVSVERALAASSTVRLVAPPADQSDKALKANQLPPSWLAVDAEGRPVGAALQMARPMRGEASTKLAETFGTQGVASVSMLDRTRMMVALLAAGIGTPDIVEVRLDRPDTIAAAIEKLDRGIALTRPSLGLLAIDVASVTGAVIVGVDANGPANGKVQVGDIVVSAGGQPVVDGATLDKLIASRKPDETLAVELKDAKGAPKRADLSVFLTPRLIGMSDQTILANRALVDLRSRLVSADDPFQQAVIRLNMAVALTRLGECASARDELKQVQLPDRPGVGNGTVQYLLGVCAEELGNRAEAEAAFKAAAATESLLTEDGPPVRELAQARLAQLGRPSGH